MSDLVQLALSLTATSGTIAELVKKYEFHGHPLDRERMRRLVAAVVVNCEQITEAIDDSPAPDLVMMTTFDTCGECGWTDPDPVPEGTQPHYTYCPYYAWP